MDDPMTNLPEETLLVAGRFRVARLAQPDAPSREVVRHPGAVTILPRLDDGRICLIRNRRPAVGQTLIELPAGTLERGEDPLAAAHRELEEETGYRAERVQLLHSFFLSPGILDERMHLFVASDLSPGTRALEPGEHLENYLVSWEDALRLIHEGAIEDAKTLVGLLLYHFAGAADSFPAAT